MKITFICPNCGNKQSTNCGCGRETGTVAGGMVGAAFVAYRVLSQSSPILSSTLLVGSLLGLAWGAKAGNLIGEKIDEIYPRHSQCQGCGEKIYIS